MAIYGNYSNVASGTTGLSIASLANKILWIDADTTFSGAAHNDPVSSWTDLSGNGYHQIAAGSARPLVQKTSNTSPNNKVLIRFDGVDDGLTSSTPATWPSVTAGYTLYFYGRLKASSSFAVLWASNNTGRPQVGYEKAASDKPYVRTEASGTAVFDLHTSNIFSNLMQFFAVVFKADSTVQAYRAISSGAVTALTGNPAYSFTPNSLSGISTGWHSFGTNGYATMDLAAELWVNVEHSAATISAVRDVWKTTYGED